MSCQNTFHHQHPSTCNCPPSPTPPWARPVQSPQVQIITGDDTIDLTKDTTYLDSVTPKDPLDPTTPYTVTLPNGNSLRQFKRIYIKDTNISPATTAIFLMTGNISSYSTLKFDAVGISAILEWTGTKWTIISGNAEPN